MAGGPKPSFVLLTWNWTKLCRQSPLLGCRWYIIWTKKHFWLSSSFNFGKNRGPLYSTYAYGWKLVGKHMNEEGNKAYFKIGSCEERTAQYETPVSFKFGFVYFFSFFHSCWPFSYLLTFFSFSILHIYECHVEKRVKRKVLRIAWIGEKVDQNNFQICIAQPPPQTSLRKCFCLCQYGAEWRV